MATKTGFPAEARHYKTSREIEPNADLVDWGGTSKRASNPWVTADALAVLSAAGRRA
jgi:ribosomal protein L28